MASPPAATAMSVPEPVPPPVSGAPVGVPLPSGTPPLFVGLGLGLGWTCALVTFMVMPTGTGLVWIAQAITVGTATEAAAS